MSTIQTIGIDLAKNVFSIHGVDAYGKCVLRKTVKILKDATARLLSVKVDASLTDEQKSLAKLFWSAAAKPLLWEGFRNWEESAEEFREQYISSHGVFLNALGVVGQCLLAQYGNLDKLSELSSLNIKRKSDTFVGRCIDEVTGNMMSNTTAIKLTAIKMLCHVDCLVPPELQALERQYFPDTEFPTSGMTFEEVSFEDVEEEKPAHPYSEWVIQKWPELSEEEVDNLCEQYERIVVEFGESVDSGKKYIQCLIT